MAVAAMMAEGQQKLRPYQLEAIAAIRRDWAAGKRNNLVVMATGTGKTNVLLGLTEEVLRVGLAKRVLILAHREELIGQPVERLARIYPHLLHQTGIMRAEENTPNRAITVASVQSLGPERLAQLLRHGKIDLIITDEGHHAVARTYREIYDGCRAANPNLLNLGVTATPLRTDEVGLIEVYGTVSYKYGIREGIRDGYLVPFKALAIQTGVSLKGVAKNDGDYAAKSLSSVFEKSNVWQLVVATHQRFAAGRRAICFTVSVAGAYELAQAFRDAGIPAAAADGTTPKDERRRILADYRTGKIEVLCNMNLFTEGLDVPEISAVHWCRPTTSDLIYVQGIGRGLRPVPGKPDTLICDYVPIDFRNIVMAGDLLGKPKAQKVAEEKAEQEGLVIEGFSFTGDEGNGIDGDPNEIVARPLNYLATSPFSWYYSDGFSTLGLGENRETQIDQTLALVPAAGGTFALHLVVSRRGEWHSDVHLLGEGADFGALADKGALYAEEHGQAVISGRGMSWQRTPISDAQARFLGKLMGKNATAGAIAALTKGEGAKLITHELARKALAKKGLLQLALTRPPAKEAAKATMKQQRLEAYL